MISSAEFQQTLQTGNIQQALALFVRDATELDITTRLTENSVTDRQTSNLGYLRTKINLLTGEIQNEVSRDILASGESYTKLQQLHHDRIIASDRIVQGYLSQLRAILASLPPNLEQLPKVASPQLNSEALLARLTQAAAVLEDPIVNTPDAQLVDNLATPDDDIDLSIDPAGAVWEEWVEDEDFSTASTTDSDWEESWVRRHLNSGDINSSNPRTTAELTTASAQWDKFVPECINIDTAPQPRTAKNSDVYR